MQSRIPPIALAFVLLTIPARGEGFWRRAATLPTPRQEVAAAALGGFVYVIGGIGTGFVSNAVDRYDPSADRWESVAPLPEPLHHNAAAGLDGFLYVFGGYRTLSFDATSAAYRYDPVRNLWSPIARLPMARAAHAAVSIGSTLYVIGGAGARGRELHAYDPSSDSWSPRAPMPTAREHLAAAVLDGRIFVAGGRVPGNLTMATFEAYDPALDTWMTLPTMPTGRSGIAAAALGSRIYVFGGEGNTASETGTFGEVESFDVLTGDWSSERSMPTPRHGIGAAVVGGRIFVPAGAILQGFGATAEHEIFQPSGARRRIVVRSP